MQHIYRRCKHCNKEYFYCTYGNGPDWGTENIVPWIILKLPTVE